MLALDLVEQAGGKTKVAPVEPLLGRRVERFDVARDIGKVGLCGIRRRRRHSP